MTPAIASATSTRWSSVKRRARLMAALAVAGPAIRRPTVARLGRSTRIAAATRAASVADWLGRRFEVSQATRVMIDTAAPSGVRQSVGVVTPIVPLARPGATVCCRQDRRWG